MNSSKSKLLHDIRPSQHRILFLSVAQDPGLMTELSERAREHLYCLDVVSAFAELDHIDLRHYEATIIDLDALNEVSERKILSTVKRKMSDLSIVLTGSKSMAKQEVPEYVDTYIPKSFGAIALMDSTLELLGDTLSVDLAFDLQIDLEEGRLAVHELAKDLYLEELQSINFWW